MLPIPFEKYIPKFFERDDKLEAFADKMDELMSSFKTDTLGLNDFIDSVKIKSGLLTELDFLLNAGVNQTDSDRIKRQKIAKAVQGHKKRGTWKDDAKPKIDAIAGGDAQIIQSTGNDDWIVPGDGLTPSAFYWATMGTDGVDDDLGIAIIGEGNEIEISGNIYIDVDNDSLTSDQVDQIVLELEEDIAPAYYRIFIGYVNVSGQFITYTIIE